MVLSQVANIPFALLDWNDLDRATRDLAQQVNASEISYDRIVALANGGLTMVRHFADLIDLRAISAMQVALYRGVNERHSEPEIIQPLTVSVENQRLLIFEDIVDTGATLEFTLKKLKELGATEIHTASLFRKSHASIHPEYAVELLDRWVIFPYEINETIRDLTEKWSSETAEEVRHRLQEIGFKDHDIDTAQA